MDSGDFYLPLLGRLERLLPLTVLTPSVLSVMACRTNQIWRRGWDLNPRYGFPYARFRGECFQPLSHLSAVGKPRLTDELAERQRCVMLRVSIGNPSGFEKRFMRNFAQRTILVSNSEILQPRIVEDRIQGRHPSQIFAL